MANIADNLKRLLGTEGHNIQEVLENADSIGGGSGGLPYIQFVVTTDLETGQEIYSVGETRGISDATDYFGACIIEEKFVNGSNLYSGNAASIPGLGTGTKYCYCTGATAEGTGLLYTTLAVTEDSIVKNAFKLTGSYL